MRSWLAVAFFLILVISAVVYERLPGNRDYGIFDTDPPTPYFHYTPTGTSLGRILVVHGLDANRNVMNLLCYALADAGFETFAIDLPGHGDSRAAFNALRARDAVEQVLDRMGPETTVLGHSLGGAILLDIAGDRHIGNMVLFSPAPTPIDHILADRILVLEGQFDPKGIRVFAPQIQDAANGIFEYHDLPWTGHSGGFFKPAVIEQVVGWLGGRANEGHTSLRLTLLVVMLVSGIAAGILFLGMFASRSFSKPPDQLLQLSLFQYTAASWIAVAILAVINVTSWLRLFATDYLIGFFFLTGLALLLWHRPALRSSPRDILIALVTAAYVIAVTGWPVSEFAQIIVTGARLWRFLAIVMLSLPLFVVDETILRPCRSRWTATGAAIVTRLLLGGIAVSGALILNREAAFLLLLTHMVILFWVALWFAGDLVRKRSDPPAAALFAAIIQAWIFSALFVTT